MSKPVQPSLSETVELFTRSLRKAVTNPGIDGYRPLPHQEKFHNSKAKGKVFLGGNRAGKTVGGATETVMKMLGKHPNQKWKPPIRARAIGSTWEDGVKKIIMPEMARWIPGSQLKNGSWEESYDLRSRTLTLLNGSKIEFLTYEQLVQAHAGTSRHHVWFDEEPPEDIFNENMLRLVDVGGEWCLTMTPLFDMSWTFERLYQKYANESTAEIEIFHAETTDNLHINPQELQILLEGMSDEEKNARTRGTYFNLSGGVYTGSFTKENFIEPIVNTDRWPIFYNTWGHFGMLDHGFRGLTAFHLGCFDEEGRIVIYAEYTASGKIIKENCKAIKRLIEDLELTDKLDYIVADPSIRNTDPITGTSLHNEYADNGLFLIFGNNDVHNGIQKVSSKFKDKSLLITLDNKNLISELPKYRWAKYASSKIEQRRNPQEVPVKKNDHSLDALRYGVMSRPELGSELVRPTGNVLQVSSAINNDMRIDEILSHPYSKWDHPEIFDETLGTDW